MRTDSSSRDARRAPRNATPRLVLMGFVGAVAAALVLVLAGPGLHRPIDERAASARAAATMPPAAFPPPAAGRREVIARQADFGDWTPTPQARAMADWVVARDDNGTRDFMVLDKVDARVYVFSPDGRLLGHSPVLLGKAKGDDSAPGIGTRPLDQIRDDEKTTPAGRFETTPGKNLNGEEVVWVDYDDAISMHRVRKVAESEHRFERLATPSPDDNRISFGCINVPVPFFDAHVVPTLGRHAGVAYVIPELRTIAQVFDEDGGHRRVVASIAPATGGRVTTNR